MIREGKHFIIVFYLLLSLPLAAQDTLDTIPKKKYPKGKWELGMFSTIDHCYRTMKPVQHGLPDTSNNMYAREASACLDSVERAATGFTIGLDVIYNFNKTLGFKTGVYYSVKAIEYNGFVWANGIWAGYRVYNFELYKREELHYFELPLMINLSFWNDTAHRFHLNVFCGLMSAINSRDELFEDRRFLPGGLDPQYESNYWKFGMSKFSNLYLGVGGGMRADILLCPRLSLNVHGMIKYYPWLWARQYGGGVSFPVLENPYSFSGGIGVNWHF